METARIAKPLTGDKLYQERARRALPLLIRQAKAGSTIFYSDLAAELDMPNARNLNYVLGSVGTALEQLASTWGETIPPVQCLVINKATRLPGNGVGWFLSNKQEFRKLSRKQQRLIVAAELQRIFAYSKWQRILSAFNLSPVSEDFTPLIEAARNYGNSGEGPEHKQLKEFVAKNPGLLELPQTAAASIEFSLPSGDLIDVLFKDGDDWVAAEVKPSSSPVADIVRGLFQCVKYRAVIEAVQATKGIEQNAVAILVLGGSLPAELTSIKNVLGVPVIENVVPT